ncbi:MAG: hypothetical protein PVJ66_03455 [Gammaproteobacteria bacterium]
MPLIIILGLGTEQQAAACGAVCIWLNSLAVLLSRLQYNATELTGYIPLIVAVVPGGALGYRLGATRLSRDAMQQILGIIVIVAVFLLGRKLLVTQ